MTNSNTPRVLFVDDDPSIRESVQDLLNLSGYATSVAENGVDALHIMEHLVPDIIVSDIMMPEMDGYSFHEAVRDNSAWSAIPFIFMSARGEKKDIHRGYLSGADFYITKPIEPEDLLVAIQSRLKRTAEIQDSIREDVERTKKQLLNIFGHELRTPLSQIFGYVQILGASQENRDQGLVDEALDVMEHATKRLIRLTEDLLLAVYLESGAARAALSDSRERVELLFLMNELVSQISNAAEEHQITVTCSVTPDLHVLGYRPYLTDLFTRLLENGITFGRMGGNLWIETISDGETVQVSIRDDGIGISPEQQEHLFQLFVQPDREKMEQQGVGIGLALAMGLAQFHNGTIRLESTPSKGSAFTVTLPLDISHTEGKAAEPSSDL